jgi:hypothetical protein
MEELTTTVTFSQDVRGGTEPAGSTVTVRVDKSGFHDAGGLGRSGQTVEPLEVSAVAEQLRTEFDPAAVRAILAHLQELDKALSM